MTPSASRDALIGQLVGGRYEVLRLIGKGGTGSIYEVRNVRLGHSFALKTLTGEAATNPEAVARFRREADIVARIKHPNIVEVIDWDELPDGSPCIIMEYLRGEDLATRIKARGPLPWAQIAVIADQVLGALTTTHSSGVVHRDLKPHNVFIALDDSGEERVKLLDFGVSKIRDSNSLQTQNDRLMGTPAYMAPEQAEGRSDQIGTHTDIWAMGVILHEMATGIRAFDGPSLPAILYAVCHGEPVPVAQYRPDAPAAFVSLLASAMQRPIPERLADVSVMRVRLREALRDVAGVDYTKLPALRLPSSVPVRTTAMGLAATIGPGPQPAAPLIREPEPAMPGKRARWPYALLAVALVGGGIAAFAFATRGNPSDNEPSTPVAVVVIDAGALASPPVLVDAGVSMDDAPLAAPDASVRETRPPKNRKPPASFLDGVSAAISRRMVSLTACINNNPDAGVNEVNATIEISPAGRATSVTLAPAAAAASPLGTCLRAGLLKISYPVSTEGGTATFPLRIRPI